MCSSLPRCDSIRTFKSYSLRPKVEDAPFPHDVDRSGNPKGLATPLASGGERDKLNEKVQQSGQNRFYFFCAFTVKSSYFRLLGTVLLVQVNTENSYYWEKVSVQIPVLSYTADFLPLPKTVFCHTRKEEKISKCI